MEVQENSGKKVAGELIGVAAGGISGGMVGQSIYDEGQSIYDRIADEIGGAILPTMPRYNPHLWYR